MPDIHPTAIVAEGASLGEGVRIGPYCIVGGDVVLGEGVILEAHVIVDGVTEIGAGSRIHPFASIGREPQDLKYRGERGRLVIGRKAIIREFVTINTGTEGGGMLTSLGDGCVILIGAHVGHDCRIGDGVLIVNNVMIAGHVHIGDHAILAGGSAVHQWVRIGAHAFLGGMSGLGQDLIPFGLATGSHATLSGLNIVGLKRHGFSRADIHALRSTYKALFSEGPPIAERLPRLIAETDPASPSARMLAFVAAHTDRQLLTPGDRAAAWE